MRGISIFWIGHFVCVVVDQFVCVVVDHFVCVSQGMVY